MSLVYRRPTQLAEIAPALEPVEQLAQSLTADLSDAAFNWQPVAGKAWSVGQVFDHLEKSARIYLDAMVAAFEERFDRPDVVSQAQVGDDSPVAFSQGWFERWFLGQIEPPPKRRLSATKKTVPAARFEREPLMAAWLAQHTRLRAFLEELHGFDTNAIRFRNPFVSLFRFSLTTGLLVTVAHEYRHLGQAERVTQSPGFPGRG